MLTALTLFSILAASEAAEPVCPSQFEHFDGYGKFIKYLFTQLITRQLQGCYHFSNVGGGQSWDEAVEYCQLFGGFLVI